MKQVTQKERKEILDNLEAGQGKSYIAFKFPFGPTGPSIVVSDITFIIGDTLICHFMMGLKSDSFQLLKNEVLAIGDMEEGDIEFSGWSGRFLVLRPELIQRKSGSDEWELIE